MSAPAQRLRRLPRPPRGASAVVLLLCVLAGAVVLVEVCRLACDTPVPLGQSPQQRANEGSGGQALAEAGAPRETLPAGEREIVRTEDSPATPLAMNVRPDVRILGRVVGQGSAVAGAEVRLTLRRLDRPSSSKKLEPVATGSDGTFSFAGRGCRDLELLLEIQHGRFAPALHRDVFHDVQPGQELDVGDVSLMAGGSVQGSVVDADGIPVRAATVRLQPEDGPLHDYPDRLFPRIGVDASGAFRFAHVPAGEYHVDATAPQLEREDTDMFRVADGESVALEPIRLAGRFALAGRVTGPDGAPIPRATVALLRARGGNWRDVRTDEDGWFRFDHLVDDVCSLRVDAKGYLRERRHDIAIRHSPRVDVTLAKGLAIAITVRGVGGGQALDHYAARARCVRSFEDVAENAARQQFQALVDGWARRQAGLAEPEKQQVVPERNAQVRDAAQRLREQGIDVDPRGRERAVDEGDARGTAGEKFLQADVAKVQEHAGGRCELSGLQEGIYVVEVSAPQHQPRRSREIELRRGTATPQVVVELERGLALAGRVVDKVTGEALRHARVELMVPRRPKAVGKGVKALRARLLVEPDAKEFADTRTDDSGAFRFEQAPPGTYFVRARATDHAPVWTERLALASDLEDLVIALGRSGEIHGRVEGLEPDAWRDVCVVITDLRTDRAVGVREDSTYRADDLSPGRYLVRAFRCPTEDGERAMKQWLERAGETQLIREDVDLGEGAEVLFDVRIGPVEVATVRGSVLVDGDGRGAHGFRIRLRELRGDAANAAVGGEAQQFDASVDQNGGWELRDVVAGRYRVSVRVRDECGDRREVPRGEILVHAARDMVLPPIALTAADLVDVPRPAEATGTGQPPAPSPQPKPQGGGR